MPIGRDFDSPAAEGSLWRTMPSPPGGSAPEDPPSYLDDILAWHRALAAGDRRDRGELAQLALAEAARVPRRGFRAALSGEPGVSVIAELKRRSPSKGDLAPGLDAAETASQYAAGGAACLSVLTDEVYFGGSPVDLVAARGATSLPVLRKDFTVCEGDLYDACLMGADAVLLIVAALADTELRRLLDLAGSLGLDALVEVHDLAEARRALHAGARLVGVNQRDLRTFAVDTARAETVVRALGNEVVTVAESGIASRADVARLEEAGFDAVLVGELLVTSPDRRSAVAALRAPSPHSASAASPGRRVTA